MSRRLQIAVVVQVVLIGSAIVAPLAIHLSGQTVFLETRPVDPRALIRGDYVVIDYSIGDDVAWPDVDREMTGREVFITVTQSRPAQFVAAEFARPSLGQGEACVRGRLFVSGTTVRVLFPQISQFFVPEGEGRVLERDLAEGLLARVKVSSGCNAVLVGLEPM